MYIYLYFIYITRCSWMTPEIITYLCELMPRYYKKTLDPCLYILLPSTLNGKFRNSNILMF